MRERLIETCGRLGLPPIPDGTPRQLLTAFSAGARKAGKAPVDLDDLPWPVCQRADELWRIALLARHPGLLTDAFRTGDNDERRAVLRALGVIDDPAHAELAAEACRVNVVPVFAALAHDNPFPARHMPERAFNQMVVKAVFLELPLARIHDLSARLNPDLARMATDLAAERRAAGRVVPADLALIGAMP
jgi:hypothetical protein